MHDDVFLCRPGRKLDDGTIGPEETSLSFHLCNTRWSLQQKTAYQKSFALPKSGDLPGVLEIPETAFDDLGEPPSLDGGDPSVDPYHRLHCSLPKLDESKRKALANRMSDLLDADRTLYEPPFVRAKR